MNEHEWLNLHEDNNYKHDFCLLQPNKEPINFKFKLLDSPIDCLSRWLSDVEHTASHEALKKHEVKTFLDLEGLDLSKIKDKIPQDLVTLIQELQLSFDFEGLRACGLPN